MTTSFFIILTLELEEHEMKLFRIKVADPPQLLAAPTLGALFGQL